MRHLAAERCLETPHSRAAARLAVTLAFVLVLGACGGGSSPNPLDTHQNALTLRDAQRALRVTLLSDPTDPAALLAFNANVGVLRDFGVGEFCGPLPAGVVPAYVVCSAEFDLLTTKR